MPYIACNARQWQHSVLVTDNFDSITIYIFDYFIRSTTYGMLDVQERKADLHHPVQVGSQCGRWAAGVDANHGDHPVSRDQDTALVVNQGGQVDPTEHDTTFVFNYMLVISLILITV